MIENLSQWFRARRLDHDFCGHADATFQSRGVLVECFFCRLKSLWRIFSKIWTLDEQHFDLFFGIACGLKTSSF